MSVPKVYVASGALGFGLSFFTGLLSRASFSVVLLRALVFGVVFVLLSLLAGFLLKRFLPELFEETPEPAAADGPRPAFKFEIPRLSTPKCRPDTAWDSGSPRLYGSPPDWSPQTRRWSQRR